MKAAEAIIKILEMEGIDTVYGIPGAGINGFYKFLGESKKIKHFCHRHEEACVHAAGGHFRASGKMAVAACTSGPGATNFVTGIYTCNIDSIPVLAITGQAVTAQLGKDAFQCVDIAKICEPVAKKTYQITDPAKVVEIFSEGFRVAREGKPGAVVIDLPLDIQNSDIEFDPSAYKSQTFETPAPDPADIKKAIEMINAAKNPLLLMGGGVVLADATKHLHGQGRHSGKSSAQCGPRRHSGWSAHRQQGVPGFGRRIGHRLSVYRPPHWRHQSLPRGAEIHPYQHRTL